MRTGLGAAIALVLLVACSAGPRMRAFTVDRAGAQAAIALLLEQPKDNYGYGRLQLTVDEEQASPPSEDWAAIFPTATEVRTQAEGGCSTVPTCAYAHTIIGVMVLDLPATSQSGATPEKTFEPTKEGVAAALAYRNEQPSRTMRVRVPVSRGYDTTTWTWTWSDVRGDVADLIATDKRICFSNGCRTYDDVRTLFYEGRPPGARWENFVREQHKVSATTFPALLRDLKARNVPGGFTLETRAIRRATQKLVELDAVSVLEDGRLCGNAVLPPTFREERCYTYAAIHEIRVRDYNRSAGEVLADALTTPFRVIGAAGAAMAIGAH